jgi:hypothetical protein
MPAVFHTRSDAPASHRAVAPAPLFLLPIAMGDKG